MEVHNNEASEEAEHWVSLNVFSQCSQPQVDQERDEQKNRWNEVDNGIDVVEKPSHDVEAFRKANHSYELRYNGN